MRGMNRVFLMGNLGSNPREGFSANGKPYVQLNIATHRPHLNENGEREKTDWHHVFVWGKQGENCQKYLKQGDPLMMEGYLTSYKQVKESGKKENKTAIHAIRVEFLSKS